MRTFGENRAGFERAAGDLHGPPPVCEGPSSHATEAPEANPTVVKLGLDYDSETREARIIIKARDA